MIEIVVLFLVLFAVFDVSYFIRGGFTVIFPYRLRRRLGFHRRISISEERELRSIVLPSDIDYLGHMNNSRFLRDFDFGRLDWYYGTNCYQVLQELQPSNTPFPVVAAISVRFRRSLHLFQNFVIKTRLLSWDEQAFYFEQRIVRSGFVCAVLLCKGTIHGINPQTLINKMEGRMVKSPPIPAELSSWIDSNLHSSGRLRREANLEPNK